MPEGLQVLKFCDVYFSYGRRPVLSGFSWSVPAGRTVLLGPNGAGKSTILSMGAGEKRPRRGAVLMGDGSQRRASLRRVIGYMPQHIRPVPGLTVADQVAYAAWLKGVKTSDAPRAAGTVLREVDLIDVAGQRATTLSGGQLRRLGLATALAHEAEVLLLDEPSVGLDPAQRRRFRDVLSRLEGPMSVVVSTHLVDDLSDLFDNVAVLAGGNVVFQGSTAEFLAHAPDRSPGSPAEAAYAALVPGGR